MKISTATRAGGGPLKFDDHAGGILSVGAGGPFCFDNELPRHRVLLEPFALADRLVTNAEFLQFMEDGGYESPALWFIGRLGRGACQRLELPPLLAPAGWRVARVSAGAASVPWRPPNPVVHVSAYEADAYARWGGLPPADGVRIGIGRFAAGPRGGQFRGRWEASPGRCGTARTRRGPAPRFRCREPTVRRCLGVGRPAPTAPIRATGRRRVHWASTTASS